jgi:hypothetical protein
LEIVIRIRTIDAMALASVLVHALLILIPMHQVPPPPSASQGPMQVVIVSPPQVQPSVPVPEPLPEPVARPQPRPPVVARREPVPRESLQAPAPPAPAPPVPAPPVDMLAMIEARRAQRRASEASRGASASQDAQPSKEDAATASLNRNLASLASGGEGVGGVFQILHIGPRTGEFAFNGWRPDSQRRWREVIEVDAGLGGNVQLAMVRRMIELIRTHYSGDFSWESFRLHRVVVLSARKEDQSGLEDFLMTEFFGPSQPHPAG